MLIILQRDRAVVSVAEFQPGRLVLQVCEAVQDLGHLVARPLSHGSQIHDFGIEPIERLADSDTDSGVLCGAEDVAAGDRPAFFEDRGKKQRPAPAFDDGAELPGEIPGVADSAISIGSISPSNSNSDVSSLRKLTCSFRILRLE